jgi:pyruvate kinase
LQGKNVKIISKIQTHEALDNFDAILEESDGIMISRQHLSLEIPPEKVFIAQKWMIEKCNLAAKPVMIISQMLESMCKAARPTRAEASDVANAILDGVDGIVLSDETAVGDYPINAVSILAKCCVEAEKTIDFRKQFNDLKLYSPAPYGTAESVAQAAVSAVLDMNVDKIIVVSETG